MKKNLIIQSFQELADTCRRTHWEINSETDQSKIKTSLDCHVWLHFDALKEDSKSN